MNTVSGPGVGLPQQESACKPSMDTILHIYKLLQVQNSEFERKGWNKMKFVSLGRSAKTGKLRKVFKWMRRNLVKTKTTLIFLEVQPQMGRDTHLI